MENSTSTISTAKKGFNFNIDLSKFSFFRKVSLHDKTVFVKEIGSMLKAGLHLTQALAVLESQIQNKYFKEIIQKIQNDIEQGGNLSGTLAKYPDVFDKVTVNIIHSGEVSGQLDKQLILLGQEGEKNVKFVGQIKGAMVYPLLIVAVMIVVGIYASVKIIPSIKEVLDGTEVKLPWTTRLVMGISDYLVNYWYLVILVFVAIIVGIFMFFKTPSGRLLLDKWALKEPLHLFKKVYITRMTRTLAMLLEAGVPIVDAVKIVSEGIGNQIYSESLKNIAVELERGVPISIPFQRDKVFPSYILKHPK